MNKAEEESEEEESEMSGDEDPLRIEIVLGYKVFTVTLSLPINSSMNVFHGRPLIICSALSLIDSSAKSLNL